MDDRDMGRRRFLRGVGGITLGLPFLGSLAAPSGRAQPPAAPKRLIVLYMPQNETEDFLPTGSGRSFSLGGTYIEPLAAFRERMIVLRGLDGMSGHQGGHTECLTGWPQGEVFRPSRGPSICQLIADRLRDEVSLPYLGTTVQSARGANSNSGTIAWTADGLPVPPIYSPRVAFERVFGPVGGAMTTDDEAARLRALEASLLDGLMDDYRRLEVRLSASDRRLLDAHLTLLREEERRLQGGAGAITCDGGGMESPVYDEPEWSSGHWPTKIRHNIDIAVRALACGSTRVATLMFGQAQEGGVPDELGVTENFHDIAHRAVSGARELHFRVREWQAEQVAYLLESLDAVEEGDGTLLDHTVVAWLPELGLWESTREGNSHSRAEVPALLVGSCAGYFDTGQLVDLGGRSYHDLLLTLVHAMGYEDVPQIGETGTSVLTHLVR